MKKIYNQKDKKLIIVEKDKIHQINIDQISYIRSESGLSSIKFVKLKNIHISKPLTFFEKELSNMGFIRSNRNELINCINIKEYIPNKKQIILINNIVLNISHRQAAKLKEFFST